MGKRLCRSRRNEPQEENVEGVQGADVAALSKEAKRNTLVSRGNPLFNPMRPRVDGGQGVLKQRRKSAVCYLDWILL